MVVFENGPVDGWENCITQGWGENKNVPPYGAPGHLGIDFGKPTGVPVRATHDGIVRLSLFQEIFGEVIVVEAEGKEYETTYAHLSSRLVSQGAVVKAGDIIGHVGNTGKYSKGSHLHFGVRKAPWNRNDGKHGYSDPTPHLDALLLSGNVNTWGPYVLSDFGAIKERMKDLQPAWTVLHDPEAKTEHVHWLNEYSNHTNVALRIYEDDSWYNENIRANPEAAAEHIARRIESHPAFGMNCFWLTVNEVCQDWSGLSFLNRYHLRLQDLIPEPLLLVSSSVENIPWSKNAPEGWQVSLMAHHEILYPTMYRGLERGDVYAVHQYNAPHLLNPGRIENESGRELDDLRIFRYEELVWPNLPTELQGLPYLIAEGPWDMQLWPVGEKAGVHHPQAAESTDHAVQQMQDYHVEWERRYGGTLPLAGRIFYCTGKLGDDWGNFRWDEKGGNMAEPLLDAMIERGVGYGTLPTPIPEPDPDLDPDPPGEDEMFDVYDYSGQKRDIEWLTENYGQVLAVSAPEGRAYRLVRVNENKSVNPAVKIRVRGLDGDPVRAAVALHWPGAEPLAGCATQPSGNADVEWTDGNGYTAFTLGADVYYLPPHHGFMKMAVCDEDVHSDTVYIGMIANRGYWKLDVEFQLVDDGVAPDPDPDPDPGPGPGPGPDPNPNLDDLFGLLWMINEKIDRIISWAKSL